MAPGSVSGGYTLSGIADTRYLSIYRLRRARRNLHFDPPKLGHHPPAGELVSPLYPLTTTAAVAVAVTTYAAVAYRLPVATQ